MYSELTISQKMARNFHFPELTIAQKLTRGIPLSEREEDAFELDNEDPDGQLAIMDWWDEH